MSYKYDPVEKPSHYANSEIETIDFIKDKLTPEQFEGFCLGNVIKYVSRHQHKGGVEDLKKAGVYLGWSINSMKGEPLEK